jgi:hypothetical protein
MFAVSTLMGVDQTASQTRPAPWPWYVSVVLFAVLLIIAFVPLILANGDNGSDGRSDRLRP